MGRQRREFVRRGGFRDDTLFVIASEGAVTEPRYFNGLRERLHTPRIHIQVLQKADPTLSSPAHVLVELDRFRSEYTLRGGDQLWLVMDRDAWKPETVSSIAQECQAKGYFLAVSNPSGHTHQHGIAGRFRHDRPVSLVPPVWPGIGRLMYHRMPG